MKYTSVDHYIPKILNGEISVSEVPLNGLMMTEACDFFVNLFQAMVDEHRKLKQEKADVM
jgi:hypothetical protein